MTARQWKDVFNRLQEALPGVAVSLSSVLVRLATDDGAPPLAIAFYRCAFAAAILPEIGGSGLRLVVEPGRYLVGAAGVLLATSFLLPSPEPAEQAPADGAR